MSQIVEALCQILLHAREQVAVSTQGDGRVGVTHALGDGQEVSSLLDQEAGMTVAVSYVRSASDKPAARRAGRTTSWRNLSRLRGSPVGRTNKKSSRPTPLC